MKRFWGWSRENDVRFFIVVVAPVAIIVNSIIQVAITHALRGAGW